MRSIPKDLLRALRQSGLEDFFVTCPYVPQREYLNWIAAARRPATRRWRIQKSIVRLFAHWTDEMSLVRAEFAAAIPSGRHAIDPRHHPTEPRRRSA